MLSEEAKSSHSHYHSHIPATSLAQSAFVSLNNSLKPLSISQTTTQATIALPSKTSQSVAMQQQFSQSIDKATHLKGIEKIRNDISMKLQMHQPTSAAATSAFSPSLAYNSTVTPATINTTIQSSGSSHKKPCVEPQSIQVRPIELLSPNSPAKNSFAKAKAYSSFAFEKPQDMKMECSKLKVNVSHGSNETHQQQQQQTQQFHQKKSLQHSHLSILNDPLQNSNLITQKNENISHSNTINTQNQNNSAAAAAANNLGTKSLLFEKVKPRNNKLISSRFFAGGESLVSSPSPSTTSQLLHATSSNLNDNQNLNQQSNLHSRNNTISSMFSLQPSHKSIQQLQQSLPQNVNHSISVRPTNFSSTSSANLYSSLVEGSDKLHSSKQQSKAPLSTTSKSNNNINNHSSTTGLKKLQPGFKQQAHSQVLQISDSIGTTNDIQQNLAKEFLINGSTYYSNNINHAAVATVTSPSVGGGLGFDNPNGIIGQIPSTKKKHRKMASMNSAKSVTSNTSNCSNNNKEAGMFVDFSKNMYNIDTDFKNSIKAQSLSSVISQIHSNNNKSQQQFHAVNAATAGQFPHIISPNSPVRVLGNSQTPLLHVQLTDKSQSNSKQVQLHLQSSQIQQHSHSKNSLSMSSFDHSRSSVNQKKQLSQIEMTTTPITDEIIIDHPMLSGLKSQEKLKQSLAKITNITQQQRLLQLSPTNSSAVTAAVPAAKSNSSIIYLPNYEASQQIQYSPEFLTQPFEENTRKQSYQQLNQTQPLSTTSTLLLQHQQQQQQVNNSRITRSFESILKQRIDVNSYASIMSTFSELISADSIFTSSLQKFKICIDSLMHGITSKNESQFGKSEEDSRAALSTTDNAFYQPTFSPTSSSAKQLVKQSHNGYYQDQTHQQTQQQQSSILGEATGNKIVRQDQSTQTLDPPAETIQQNLEQTVDSPELDMSMLREFAIEQELQINAYKEKEATMIKLLIAIKKSGVDIDSIYEREVLELHRREHAKPDTQDAVSENPNEQPIQENSKFIDDIRNGHIPDYKHVNSFAGFADESIINDSDESSFNYFGKSEGSINDNESMFADEPFNASTNHKQSKRKSPPKTSISAANPSKKKFKINLEDIQQQVLDNPNQENVVAAENNNPGNLPRNPAVPVGPAGADPISILEDINPQQVLKGLSA